MKMVVIPLQVLNRPQLVPCGVDVNGNNHLIILDPVNKCVEVVELPCLPWIVEHSGILFCVVVVVHGGMLGLTASQPT